MKKFRRFRRAGAGCLAGVFFVLFSAGAYLQASEETQRSVIAAETEIDASAGIAAQAETGSETASLTDGQTSTKTGTEAGGQVGTETGTEAGTETESESGTETETSAETAEQTETETSAEIAGQTETDTSAETAGQTETETSAEIAGQTETETLAETTGQTETETPAETAGQTETDPSAETAEQAETGTETEPAPEEAPESETEEGTEQQLKEVLDEAQRQNIDMFGLAPGESLTFYASVGQESGIMTMAVTAVTVTCSDKPYYYSDYGYGTHWTNKYTVSFNDITATAYCVQPSRSTPGSSSGYAVTRMPGAKLLAKVCYYGTKASGEGGYFATMHPDLSEGQRFIITHLAAAYANGSPDAFYGANEKAQNLARELYEYCVREADIPEVDMEFSETDVTAYPDSEIPPAGQRTGEITLRADPSQSVTFALPAGVVLHNLTTGRESGAGETVTIPGGTTFYLSAPLTQATDVGEVWTTTLRGNVTKDFSAYKITTGADTQDLALVFGDGIEQDTSVPFTVRWLKPIPVELYKTDAQTGKGLSGALFSAYADPECHVLYKDFPATDAQGRTSAVLYGTQDVLYLVEEQAPAGYMRSEQVTPLPLQEAAQTGQGISRTFPNEPISAKLKLTKRDAQTGTAQGDAVLSGAVYGLYARRDIVHPDGSTGVLFRAGQQVTTMTTDAAGKASVDHLYPGQYYVKEISPPSGYLLDGKEYDVSFEAADGAATVIEKECVSTETVMRQPFQIIKVSGSESGGTQLLEGAGFTAYLKSSLRQLADGSYDFASAKPVPLGKNGETELFTNQEGYAVSAPLAFGTYLVRETTVPPGHKPVKNFEVRISENAPTEPQVWRVLVDEEFEAKLKIIKSDDETHQNVCEANTEFKVYDKDAGAYVVQTTTYPKVERHSSYFTDEEGYLILPQSLPRGHYRIEEVTAPEGYTLGGQSIEVNVDSNVAYRMNDTSNDAIIEVVASNHPVKGELRVRKKGEVLKGRGEDFQYEEEPIPGAVYEVFAAENIYTADHQRDADGNRTLEYAKGAKVGELTTGSDGEAVLRDLPLGKYRVTEKSAPEGFLRSEEEQYAQLVYIDQDTPVVTATLTFVNERQKVEITALKKDAENEAPLAGAEFALYAKEEILAGKTRIAEADEQLATAVTGEDGKAVFAQDLPLGSYYVRELRAPDGYLPSSETVELSASYKGQETETVRLEAAFADEPTRVDFTKSDVTTGTELDGATLSVLDEKGDVVDSWVSERGKPHRIRCLHIGETYVLREEFAPYGYLRAEEVKFTVEETGEVQKVKMEDAVPVGRIVISKTGEFVNSVTWNEMVTGTLEGIFGYVSGSLQQVVFEVYAAEDIHAADGVSEDYYQKDELVATITTDALGYARTEDLPLGKYYVVEKKTGEGFLLDDKPRQVDLTYRDQDTPVVTYDEKWQNSRQKAKVTVQKCEAGTGQPLAGGVFALCARTDIAESDGTLLLKADAVIEQKATGADGRLTFCADLPIGGSYYVKEIKAPAGYATTGEVRDFTFTYAGDGTEEVAFDFTFENQPTQVSVSKTDITTGKELPGAKLEVRDEGGTVVDSWVSQEEPHLIQGLEAGKAYTLREESAPRGYVIAEEITFQVGDTGAVQTVTMEDDCVVGKVRIRKTDQLTGKPMKGVEFELRDSKGKLLERLVTDRKGRAESQEYPVMAQGKKAKGKAAVYTLKETKTLDGYRLDETEHKIRFSCEDDKTRVVEYRLDLKNERLEEESPKTGDDTDLALPVVAMAVSGCAAILLALGRKRKKRLS